jgi:hypothetical protein
MIVLLTKYYFSNQKTENVAFGVWGTVLVGKYTGVIPLRRCKCTCEDNDKMGFKGIDLDVQDRDEWRTFVNTLMKFGFHYKQRMS